MRRLQILLRDLFVNGLAASVWVPNPIRAAMYRMYGIRTQTTHISPRCCFGRLNVVIGRGTFINYGCFFDNSGSIVIGERCFIGMEAMVCTSTHQLGSEFQRAGEAYGDGVLIGDGVWVGARAIILPEVTMGNGCVIAAGAVVTKNCEPNGLYAGVPARRISELAS